MKQIGLALVQYAEENAGAYPPDLRTLIETDYLTDESIYRCPSRRRPNPEFSDYQYLGKGRQCEDPAFPILGMLFFSYGTRERYRRIACQSNLKQIITALYWYAEENGGVYPSDLRTLSTAEYLTDESVYRCPSRRAPKPEFSDYQYLGKGRLRDEAAFPILRDLPGNHPGRYRCVLFSDGSVCAETDAGNTKEKRY